MPSLSYTYDKAGNIETVSEDGELRARYHYDGLNRLVREDNKTANKTYTWAYDVGGNITEKCTYTYTDNATPSGAYTSVPYSYASSGWKDQLTSYNGQSIVYDTLGNPTTYRGNTLTWSHVRRLASYGSNTFEYGADGIRYKKNNITYTLDGTKILRETDGASRNITYYYGIDGVIGFNYNGLDFYYRKNLQGDVIAIYSACGMLAATYAYDAWGKLLYSNDYSGMGIDAINPFRYRSYYYDTETGLYYLNSRYYDSETGRFINADDPQYIDPETLGGLSLYAYCLNNPVNMTDENGNWSIWATLGVAVGAILCIAAVSVLTCGVGTAAVGAIGATVAGAAKGALIGAAVGTVAGAGVGYVTTGTLEGTLEGAAIGFGIGAVVGAVVGGVAGYASVPQPGVDFNPKGFSGLIQKGVNPRTIQHGRARLEPQKVIKNLYETLKKGEIEDYIKVGRDGIVSNGNHRLFVAKLLKITIKATIAGMG